MIVIMNNSPEKKQGVLFRCTKLVIFDGIKMLI